MKSNLFLFFIFSFALAGCIDCQTSSCRGTDTLSLKVESSVSMDVKEFNAIVKSASEAGATWTNNPLLIIENFLHLDGNGEVVMVFSGEGRMPDKYNYVIHIGGYRNDSVQGERFDITIEKKSAQLWLIQEAKKSWRCWPDRGHDFYSTEPCV